MTDKTLCDGCGEVVIEEVSGQWFRELAATKEDRKTLLVGDLLCGDCVDPPDAAEQAERAGLCDRQ